VPTAFSIPKKKKHTHTHTHTHIIIIIINHHDVPATKDNKRFTATHIESFLIAAKQQKN
jgi:hypothetical protein